MYAENLTEFDIEYPTSYQPTQDYQSINDTEVINSGLFVSIHAINELNQTLNEVEISESESGNQEESPVISRANAPEMNTYKNKNRKL